MKAMQKVASFKVVDGGKDYTHATIEVAVDTYVPPEPPVDPAMPAPRDTPPFPPASVGNARRHPNDPLHPSHHKNPAHTAQGTAHVAHGKITKVDVKEGGVYHWTSEAPIVTVTGDGTDAVIEAEMEDIKPPTKAKAEAGPVKHGHS